MIDPYTQIIAKLWDVLTSFNDWAALVKVGNRLELSDSGQLKAKIHRAPADFAEFRIIPAPGGQIALFNTSDSSVFLQNFLLQTASRKLDPSAQVFPIKFQTIRAFAKAISDTGDRLGLDFVEKVRFLDAIEMNDSPDLSRDSGWWAGVLTLSVQFRLKTQALINGEV